MNKNYDIIVVGAGFAGLACAQQAARSGLRVLILERKQDVGLGIRTTGILVKDVFDHLIVPDHLLRRINRIRLYSPSLRHLDLQSDDYFFCTTDTPNLMRYLLQQAKSAGAEIKLDYSFKSAENRDDGFYIPDLDISAKFIIGADGAKSEVASFFNFPKPKKFLIGTEYEYAKDVLDIVQFHCFLDQELAPGYLGWIAPGIGITQVGLACRQPYKPDMKKFFEKIRDIVDIRALPFHGNRGGLIPVDWPLRDCAKGNVIIVGDAASHVSPLTAGGIDYALRLGYNLADALYAYIKGQTALHPGKAIQKYIPTFAVKQLMRMGFYHACPNWMMEIMIHNPAFRLLAQQVFFKHKKTA
ncbi:MAG: NAD(P)/FAD-dependent oxidoreductase [Alphaproteobacteria bacterium]|nr:MAG: NAD(P)/FAD-dependent oxidoreductase [Alphaproteobacteria bacterium]